MASGAGAGSSLEAAGPLIVKPSKASQVVSVRAIQNGLTATWRAGPPPVGAVETVSAGPSAISILTVVPGTSRLIDLAAAGDVAAIAAFLAVACGFEACRVVC